MIGLLLARSGTFLVATTREMVNSWSNSADLVAAAARLAASCFSNASSALITCRVWTHEDWISRQARSQIKIEGVGVPQSAQESW